MEKKTTRILRKELYYELWILKFQNLKFKI
jgi:hypothetical protein